MVKWLARLAILAAFLGVVGTIIIISYLHLYPHKEKLKDENKNEPRPDSIVYPQTVIPQPKRADSLPAPQPPVVIKKEDAVHKLLPEKKESLPKAVNVQVSKLDEKKIVAKDAIIDKGDKKNAAKKDQEEKLFSEEELQQIVSRINVAKESNNISSNCVQIFNTQQTSKTRTVSQVETYLRSQRFAIAGRETISKKVKGIQIAPAGGCIRVTIGSL